MLKRWIPVGLVLATLSGYGFVSACGGSNNDDAADDDADNDAADGDAATVTLDCDAIQEGVAADSTFPCDSDADCDPQFGDGVICGSEGECAVPCDTDADCDDLETCFNELEEQLGGTVTFTCDAQDECGQVIEE